MPTFEKSCGGVVYRQMDDKIEYLLIFNKKGRANGHWGFPKGHVEKNETEKTTALREIKEETGLDVSILDKFKANTRYSPKVNVLKDVVYFLARADKFEVQIQETEVADFVWQEFNDAKKTLTNSSDRNILERADGFLQENLLK